MLTGYRHPHGSPQRSRHPAHHQRRRDPPTLTSPPPSRSGARLTHEGDRLKVYVVEVRRSSRGPQVLISRTHPGLVKRLFELEVPEIYDGTVEITLHRPRGGQPLQAGRLVCRRERGPHRCLRRPQGRQRVNNVVDELGGEKMDIIKY